MMKKIILILCLFSLTSCFQLYEEKKQEKDIKKIETSTWNLVLNTNEEHKVEVSTWQTIQIENEKIEVDKTEIEKKLELEEQELLKRLLEEENTSIIDETKKIEEVKEYKKEETTSAWSWEIIENKNETVVYERENSTSSNFFNSLQWSTIEKQEITEEFLKQTIWEEADERIRKKMKEVAREVNEYLKKEE